ncbi:MAG: SH3 domain-containing protein [Gammaproteobacteria bacterium]|nr:MAG: SH3 domain-containing protein [Gammaproteobacteria bacterium]
MGSGVIQPSEFISMNKLIFLLLLMSVTVVHASPVWVAVKKTTIRKNASNLSPVVVKVKYQDELELLDEQGDWWQVKYENNEGWVHKSALSKSLDSGAKQQKSTGKSLFDAFRGKPSASQSQQAQRKQRGGDTDDITLAGKGFNEDVEGEFKSQGSELNYAAVDLMENREIPPFDFQKFADEGDLDYVIEQAKKEEEEEKKSWGGFSLPGGLFK